MNDYHWLIELLDVVTRRLDDATIQQGHRQLMETLWSRHAGIVGGSN